MKKILYICESMGGGVRRHFIDILLNIDKNFFKIYVIYSSKRADDVFQSYLPFLEKQGIVFFNLDDLQREISIIKDTRCLLKILKIKRAVNPDIIHCHSSKAGALGRLLKIFDKKIKIYYTPHAYYSQNPELGSGKKFIFILIERLLSLFTDKTINVSFGENNYALTNGIVNARNSIVIYNGVERPKKNYGENIGRKKKFIIGTVARVDHQKDPFTFIKIAEILVKRYPEMEFVYVGDGPLLSEVNRYLKANNLEKRIRFIGFHNSPMEVMKEFDIYISTSLYEGLPYSVIEAMSFKKPLVLSNVIGNNELVVPNYNGELFPVKSVDTAVYYLETLFKDLPLLSKYSENSYRLFEEKFTLDVMIRKLTNLYNQTEY